MENVGSVVIDGIPSNIYHPSKSMNDISLQKQLGFCNPKSPIYFTDPYIQEKGCLPYGIMDVSSCLPGSPPIYISQSHFLGSPPELRQQVIGIREPNQKTDQTYLNIEPTTGIIIRAHQRSQINLGFLTGQFTILQKMSNVIIPMIYLEEEAFIDADTYSELMQGITTLQNSRILAAVLTFFGAIFLLAFTILTILEKAHHSSNYPENNTKKLAIIYEPFVNRYGL